MILGRLERENAAGSTDRCPWPRPFPADFGGCPAFQPVDFVVADSLNRTLGSSRTCRHLSVGAGTNGHSSRYYARCALGDTAQRRRWLAEVRPERAAVMRALQEEFDEFSRTYRHELFAARTRALADSGDGDARARLDTTLAGFLAATRGFLESRVARFADVDVAVEDLVGRVEGWADAWQQEGAPASPQLQAPDGDPEQLSLLGRAVPLREALHHGNGNGNGNGHAHDAAPPALEPLLATGTLRVERGADPPRLVVSGEIDAATSADLERLLAAELAGGGSVDLDLGGVLFCDLGGVRAILHAARRAGCCSRVVVHAMPAHLRRAVRLAGWEGVPELVLAEEAGA